MAAEGDTVFAAAGAASKAARGKPLAGQVAIVTGGGQGIGFGIATRLGELGAKLALFDMNEEVLGAAVAKLGEAAIEAEMFPVNVANAEQVNAAVAGVEAKWGQVDIVVQAAGITGLTGIKSHEVEEANFDLVMDVNVKGIFLVCKAVIPGMLKRDYGRIVNIASISGKEGNAGMLAYSTSKAAVIGLTKVMGKEYAETNITVNAIAPAVVRTEMVAAMPAEQVKYMTDKIPMKRTGEIDEIAALAAFIASPDSSFTTGFTFDATGGRATF